MLWDLLALLHFYIFSDQIIFQVKERIKDVNVI